MKVLTIGSDKKLFEKESPVLSRAIEYSSKMEEGHIVVFTLSSDNLEEFKIGNLRVYPTRSASRWFYPFDAYSLGKKIITEQKFIRGASVVSAQDPFEAGLVAMWLQNKFRLPLHIQAHTNFFSSFFKTSFLNRLRLFISSFVLPKANGLRVVSLEIAEAVRAEYPTLSLHIDILPIFVDIKSIINAPVVTDLKKMFPQFKFIVLTVSRLEPEKRLETALYAFKKLVLEFPHAGLVIVGDGSERSRLETLVSTLGLSPNVVFLGWQSDLTSLYKSANAFLFTSAYEGYGMAIVEAAAAGCPIVTTNVGVARELCSSGQNSYVCPVDDTECLASSVRELISDEGKRLLFSEHMSSDVLKLAITREEYVNKYIQSLARLVPLDDKIRACLKSNA